MGMKLSSFIQQAKTAEVDHAFTLDPNGKLETGQLAGQRVSIGQPDPATKAFVAALHSELKYYGGEPMVRQVLANIGLNPADPTARLTAGHVQALRIELAHLVRHGEVLGQDDLAERAQDKAGRQRLARELRLTPDSSGQRATIKNRLSSHNALIDLAAIDMRELRPEPRRGPKVANRPPGFAPPMVPETASRKDLGRLEQLALQVDRRGAGQPEPSRLQGKDFYVEPQQSASCARHAINALASGPLVSDQSLTAFKMYRSGLDHARNHEIGTKARLRSQQQALDQIKEKYNLDDDYDLSEVHPSKRNDLRRLIGALLEDIGDLKIELEQPKDDTPLDRRDFDAASGNDHVVVRDYLNFLHHNGVIDDKYDAWSIDLTGKSTSKEMLTKVPDTIPGDRCIVTTHKPSEHHVAFRKDHAGDWWLLDSKGPKREQISPQDYLERMREAGNDTVGIVFQKQDD